MVFASGLQSPNTTADDAVRCGARLAFLPYSPPEPLEPKLVRRFGIGRFAVCSMNGHMATQPALTGVTRPSVACLRGGRRASSRHLSNGCLGSANLYPASRLPFDSFYSLRASLLLHAVRWLRRVLHLGRAAGTAHTSRLPSTRNRGDVPARLSRTLAISGVLLHGSDWSGIMDYNTRPLCQPA